MKIIASRGAKIGMLIFVGSISLVSSRVLSAATSNAPPFGACRGQISWEFIRSHGWVRFHDGKVMRFDPAASLLAVDLQGKHYGIYITPETQICRDDRTSSVKEIKVGDRVGGYTKVIDRRSVGMELGFGNMERAIPFGRALRSAIGFIRSPYALDKPAIKIDPHTPTGTLIKCPYTGKMFQMPNVPSTWTNHSGGEYYRRG